MEEAVTFFLEVYYKQEMSGLHPKLPHEDHPLDNVGRESNPEKELAKWTLRTRKLQAIADLNTAENFLTSEEEAALKSMSEREKVEIKALARLYMLADSDPYYLQLKQITGGRDREEIAEKLTKSFMEKQMVENVMNRIIAPETSRDILESAQRTSARNYMNVFPRNL